MPAAGAKAFEWKQEIGINQARRTGKPVILASAAATDTEIASKDHAVLDGLLDSDAFFLCPVASSFCDVKHDMFKACKCLCNVQAPQVLKMR